MDLVDLEDARGKVFDYIERYYNTVRLHTALGMTPNEFAESVECTTPSAEFRKHGRLPESEKKLEDERLPAPTHGRSPSYRSKEGSPADSSYVSPGNSSEGEICLDVEPNLN